MKKTLLTLLAGIPLLAAAQGNYTLKGKIGSVTAPSKVFLSYRLDGKPVMDSAVFKDGTFSFAGTVKDVTAGTLILDYKGVGYGNLNRRVRPDMLQVYLEPGNINVTSADSLFKATVSGSKVNDQNKAFKAALKPASDKMTELGKWYTATPKEKRETKEFDEEYEKRYEAIEKEQSALAKTYVKAHTDQYISLVALNTIGGSFPEYAEMSPLYNSLSADVKNTANGKAYAGRLEKWKLVALGAQAPLFSQTDTAGKVISLASFKGKYTLVDFWASWCGPCRADNPNVVKAYNKFKDKNFTILGVSLDQPGAKDKWLEAIHKDGLTWTHVSDLKYWNNEAAQAYGVQAIPQNYLLDPQGKIVGKNLHGQELENKLAELLGKI
jgi:peroxiredoxin